MAAVGGFLGVDSAPGHGTTVRGSVRVGGPVRADQVSAGRAAGGGSTDGRTDASAVASSCIVRCLRAR